MSENNDPHKVGAPNGRQAIAVPEQLEQDARIALMDHFRFYLQYWGTILVALAAAFFSVVQLAPSNPPFFAFLGALIVGQAAYAVAMTIVHGKLCELAVKLTQAEPAESGTDHVICLHKTVLSSLNRGYLLIRTWHGWGVFTLLSFSFAVSALANFYRSWLSWPGVAIPVIATVACLAFTIVVILHSVKQQSKEVTHPD